jgi:hypothetical protein
LLLGLLDSFLTDRRLAGHGVAQSDEKASRRTLAVAAQRPQNLFTLTISRGPAKAKTGPITLAPTDAPVFFENHRVR